MTPLPADFLRALEDTDEVIVTSRAASVERSVRAWFVIAPPGVVYLFNYAFAFRVRRWRSEPWVRLTAPATRASAEGTVHFVSAAEVTDEMAEPIVERWGMWGAVTPSGLRRMITDGSHVLIRVEGAATPAAA